MPELWKYDEPLPGLASEVALILSTTTTYRVSCCTLPLPLPFILMRPSSTLAAVLGRTLTFYRLFPADRASSSYPAYRGLLSAYSVELSGGHVHSEGCPGSDGGVHPCLEARYTC